MIERFTVSRDDRIYQAFPDVALTPSGRLVCVFSECTHHANRNYTCIKATCSDDRGRTWSAKRPVTPPRCGPGQPFWNCARLTALSDGRLVMVVDRIRGKDECDPDGEQSNWLWFSRDEGRTWDGPQATPVRGIVPGRLVELRQGRYAGRWLLHAHLTIGQEKVWAERAWLSDDQARTWTGPFTIAGVPELLLCEGTVSELPGGELVCFLRENSMLGRGAFKTLSRDGGTTWSTPVEFPLPGCHRPQAGMLQNGQVLITFRFCQGGQGWLGWWTQNLFAGVTDVASCLASSYLEAHTRILPLDFDRSPESDTGYSGWVQFADGGLYVVNYIMDDAPKAQIRGYALTGRDFLLS